MSANHAGSILNAKEIIYAVSESGADCIKVQTSYKITENEKCNICFRKSIFAIEDIRPGYGMPPKYYDEILG